MDRNQRSRRQKSVSGSYSQAPKRSMGSRMGLENRAPHANSRRKNPRRAASAPPSRSTRKKPGTTPPRPNASAA